MKKDVKLVICDIDGTLVNSDKELMPITKEMFERLHKDGVMLGIASGRPAGDHLAERAALWGFDFQFDVIIGMNGGQMWDATTDQRYEYYPLKKEYIKEIIEFMEPTGVNSYVYYGDSTLVRWFDERMEASSVRNFEPMIVAKSDEEMWAKDNNKLLFRCATEEEADACFEFAKNFPSENYQFFKTCPIMVEFQDPRVNKGYALKKFCELHNFSIDQVIAFGDAQNDNELLEVAGIGVCMPDGQDCTKACANVISEYDCDHDAVGRFIQKYVYEEA